MKIYIPYLKHGGGKGFFFERLYQSLLSIDNCFPSCDEKDSYDVALHISQKNDKIKSFKHIIRMDGVIHNNKENYVKKNKILSHEIEKCDAIIYQSNFCKLMAGNYLGISDRKKSNIISNGASVEFYKGISKKERQYSYVVMTYANWRPHKRLSDIIESFIISGIKDSCLYIAGDISRSGIDPSEIDKFMNIKNVIFLGKINQYELAEYLVSSDVFIHLSWIDWCPNSVVEALCAGIPVICNNIGGTRELIKDGCGKICDIDDEYDMSPCSLYSPPAIDYRKVSEEICYFNDHREAVVNNNHVNIRNVSYQYKNFFNEVMG